MFGCVRVEESTRIADVLLERPSMDNGNKSKLGFAMHPSPQITMAVVEQHDSVLSTQVLLEHTVVALMVMVDNEAMDDMCRRSLGLRQQGQGGLHGAPVAAD